MSLSRIFGWSPSKREEHVDVPPRPTLHRPSPLRISTGGTSRGLDYKSVGTDQPSPTGYEMASPASSIYSLSLDGGSQADPEPLRRGDPDWVARPRNPFIIFRCEYSREHSKEGKRVRRPPGSQTEKTLSKRAAEAWHQLSAEEKNRFKKLADEEREEHARLHPNYRFRPVKRTAGKKRSLHVPRLQPQPSESPSTTVESIVAPVPRYPPSCDAEDPTPPSMLHDPPVPMNISVLKATRRRSASAPSLPFMQPRFTGYFNTESEPRLKVKRSRSLMANRTTPNQAGQTSSFEDLSFDPSLFDLSDYSGEFYIPDSLSSDAGSVEIAYNDQFSNYGTAGPLSPLSAVASSISSWQGEQDMGYQLAPGGSPWSPSLPVGIEGDPLHQYTAYQSTEAGVATAADFTSPNEPWMTSSHFPAAMSSSMTNTTEGTGSLYAPMTPSSYDEAELERAYALQEYGLGLDVHAGEALTMGEDPVCAALEGNRYY